MDCQKTRNALTTYGEVTAYINDIPKFTKKNHMEDTKAFLSFLTERLGYENNILNDKVIHVAGTNGKGSVCAYLHSVLSEAGYRTGLFTSPHLVTMRERFRIGDRMISEAEFVSIFGSVMEAATEFAAVSDKQYHPTFFELLFFMGIVFFVENQADYIVLETGLGGRLDTTNCIAQPLISIITEVGLDHTEYLGETIAEIASEKAGIIKKGTPLVYWSGRAEAAAVIEKQAAEMESMAVPVSEKDIRALKIHKKYIDFSIESRYYNNIRVTLPTSALYQTENAALAVRALELIGKGAIAEERITNGLFRTKWEGRMEEILPEVFLDGAHNEDGIRALLDTVRKDGCEGSRILLFGVMKDKHHRQMAELLTEEGLFRTVVLTLVDSGRSLGEEQLKNEFVHCTAEEILYFDNAETAFSYVIKQRGTKDRVYISGSLYLAGQIKAALKRKSRL